jgi:glycosyltransferase involved in cell wall biosynthesis
MVRREAPRLGAPDHPLPLGLRRLGLQKGTEMSQMLTMAEPRAGGRGGKALVSVVIPLYNEQEILDGNLEILAACLDRVVGSGKWLFLLVENGSTDGTPAAADTAVQRWPGSSVLHLEEPNYGVALKAGLTTAATPWIYAVDIEQWDLPFIAWSWKNREMYDLLLASKRADPTICHQHIYRRLLSCALNGLLQVLVQFTGTDTHGLKLLDRTSLQPIIDLCELDRGQYDTELVLRAMRGGKRIVEVPVLYREMRPNRNWMVKKIVWNLLALRRLVRVMKHVPYEGHVRYYRLAREDVLADSDQAPVETAVYDRA